MAISFVAADSSYGTASINLDANVSAQSMSVSMRLKMSQADVAASKWILTAGTFPTNHQIFMNFNEFYDNIMFGIKNGTSQTGGYHLTNKDGDDVWTNYLFTFNYSVIDQTNWNAFVEGVDEGLSVVATNTGTQFIGSTTLYVNAKNGTPDEENDMLLQDLAFYDGLMTIADAKELAAGASPLQVRPNKLFYYWPLVRDGKELIQGADMTLNSTTVVSIGLPTFQPATPIIGVPVAAAATGAGFPFPSSAGLPLPILAR